MSKVIFILCIIAYSYSVTFSQSVVNSTTPIRATIVQGLSISHEEKTSLEYGEIVLSGQAVTTSIKPSNGAVLLVEGGPDKNVTITYSPAILSNETWAKQNSGQKSQMVFTPDLENTGKNNLYLNPSKIVSGNSYKLEKVKNDGRLYLWVGGSIYVNKTQAEGDYQGTFVVNVTY